MIPGKQKGFVQLVIILLVAILSLSYFGIDLEQAFTKPLFKKNLLFTWHTAKSVWTNYIYDPLTGLFNKDDSENTEENSETPTDTSVLIDPPVLGG